MNKLICILIVLLTHSASADEIIVQTGSYDGMLGIGYGKQFTEDFKVDSIYGWTDNIGPNVISSTIKAKYVGDNIDLGLKAIFTLDKDTFILLPDKYPRRYYPPTGLYFAPFISMQRPVDDKFSVYIELSTLDYYLEYWARNKNNMHIMTIINWGVGVTYELGDE